MPELIYDIGSLRERPECLYDICTFLSVCDDSFVWDRNSDCYKAFHAVFSSLWSALPPSVSIDLRDTDTISKT